MSISPPRLGITTVGLIALGFLALIVPAGDHGGPVAVVDLPGQAGAISVSGRFAFVAVDEVGVQVFDLLSPSDTGAAATLELPDLRPSATAIWEHHVVVASGEAGLRLVDVSDPLDPIDAGSIAFQGPAIDVAVKAGIVYVAGGRTGLWTIDLGSSEVLGHLDLPGEVLAIAVRGSRAVLAAGEYGVRIVDVSDPAALVEEASCFLPGAIAVDLAVDRSHAYVAGGHGGLRIVDISRPASPVEINSRFSIEARSIDISGNLVVVGTADDGIHVYSRNSGQPLRPTRQMETRGQASSVVAASGFAFVAGDHDLFEVFDVGGNEIFSDGFEIGDVTSWSSFFPPGGWIDCELVTIADLREGGTSQIATLSNGADVKVEIVRTSYTFPSWLPDSPMYIDYLSVTEDSHFTAYWDGTGYSPLEAETIGLSFAGVDPLSSTTWFVDFDGSGTWPEYWNGTFEVCLDIRVVGTDFTCSDICTSETWISTVPTYTPTRTATSTYIPYPTQTPTIPPEPITLAGGAGP